MTNEEYLLFEKPFKARAQPIMDSLASLLTDAGYGQMMRFDVVRDDEQGIGFMPVIAPEGCDDAGLDVQLLLVNLEEEGVPGVGLRMECSMYDTGVVWAPGNYTPYVSILRVEEMERRLDMLADMLPDVVQRITMEWDRVVEQVASAKPTECAT